MFAYNFVVLKEKVLDCLCKITETRQQIESNQKRDSKLDRAEAQPQVNDSKSLAASW